MLAVEINVLAEDAQLEEGSEKKESGEAGALSGLTRMMPSPHGRPARYGRVEELIHTKIYTSPPHGHAKEDKKKEREKSEKEESGGEEKGGEEKGGEAEEHGERDESGEHDIGEEIDEFRHLRHKFEEKREVICPWG